MPEEIKEKIEATDNVIATEKPRRRFWRVFAAVFLSIAGLAVIIILGAVVYANNYSGTVYPGVYLGGYSLGGMSAEEVRNFVAGLDSRLGKEGVTYVFEKEGQNNKINVGTTLVEGDSVLEMISVKSGDVETEAMAVARENSGWQRYFWPLVLRFSPVHFILPVTIDQKNYSEMLKNALSPFEREPKDARIKIISTTPVNYEIVPEQNGVVFDYDGILKETSERLAVLNLEPVTIRLGMVTPETRASDLSGLAEKISRVLSYGDIVLTYVDPLTTDIKTGRITVEDVTNWLTPKKAGQEVVLELDREKTGKQIENYKYVLDKPAEESKFVMENGQVKEFRGGSSGQILNVEKTIEAVNALMRARNTGSVGATSTISLIVDAAEPKIKFADINNLGITAIIGTGTSTFHDSHTNRIKNIAHAVERLNGTIIAPGEEFSTSRYAGPFTAEIGYLPEEVIKGTKIEKEIGGGMCQIGTTLFRMAMNSGMAITERINHSLVVGYYADPVNGNPGTDATIYDPIADLKFLNDTGGYLLLQTDINYKKQMLTFTLWGKPDGRSGYYSHPLVSKWIPAGEPKDIYTTTLAPGEKKCQNAFRGAIASFTYTRFTSSSEKIDRVFTSYYRPLPKICMIGVDPLLCPDVNNCQPPPMAATSGTPSASAATTSVSSSAF